MRFGLTTKTSLARPGIRCRRDSFLASVAATRFGETAKCMAISHSAGNGCWAPHTGGEGLVSAKAGAVSKTKLLGDCDLPVVRNQRAKLTARPPKWGQLGREWCRRW